jgi:hypothetical protein
MVTIAPKTDMAAPATTLVGRYLMTARWRPAATRNETKARLYSRIGTEAPSTSTRQPFQFVVELATSTGAFASMSSTIFSGA